MISRFPERQRGLQKPFGKPATCDDQSNEGRVERPCRLSRLMHLKIEDRECVQSYNTTCLLYIFDQKF